MNNSSEIKFDPNGLVPAIAQDAGTLEVLMLAYMNRESLELTLSTGKAHFYSRSRQSLWLKGETSGNFLEVKSVRYDCDGDTVLLLVEPKGPACHTGERSCFYRSVIEGERPGHMGPRVLTLLYDIIKERKNSPPDKSYVASLYARGLPKILAKIEEESGELIEAAREKGKDEVLYEFCDLWFHTMVLLANEGLEIEAVFAELGRRFGVSGITEKESRGKKG
ncbi:MAG: bifunctional phosphoribosyl-AMP cyclohydrolase/phosphoribosyl-ATP diphosphatase HisIE [Deltaproteobacteria bacterium]|nr:bifunctional phosphoribosyl-AMP cyclohydrolase/phosphoribosyl-ATP diphosphatase HisIE [Deltaproteobacteria bacterium]